MEDNDFKILSLDGGGIRGAFSASVLAAIEKNLEEDKDYDNKSKSIIDYFDLVTATSTGGIIAIGLGLGKSAQEMVTFYDDNAELIFPLTGLAGGIPGMMSSLWRDIRKFTYGPKHDPEQLHESLESVFESKKLGHSKSRLIITAYNGSSDNAHFFKTYHVNDSEDDPYYHGRHYRMSASDIAMATSAAPLYYAAKKLPLGDDGEGLHFLDGGVFANTPILPGIAEAVRFFNKPIDKIKVLSIGTTYKRFKLADSQQSGGVVNWGLDLGKLLFSAQQASVVGTTRVLLNDRFQRITQSVDKDIKLDDSSSVGKLIDLGLAVGEDSAEKVKSKFCLNIADKFTPEKMP